MTRNEAISEVVRRFKHNEAVLDLVTMFGLTPEEILEGGASYETVLAIKSVFK